MPHFQSSLRGEMMCVDTVDTIIVIDMLWDIGQLNRIGLRGRSALLITLLNT